MGDTGREQIPDTRDQTIYIFCTYRSPYRNAGNQADGDVYQRL